MGGNKNSIMGRHPGPQHQNRMRDIQDKLTRLHCTVLGLSNQSRDIEEKLAEVNRKKRLMLEEWRSLYEFQKEMNELEGFNDWGLPDMWTPKEDVLRENRN